jgi:hypothetical protein
MANLSGQTIQSTYPGLLNLNTATSGITSTPQAITDGYGNDTGLKIATDYLSAPNIPNLKTNFIPQYMGASMGLGSATNPALIQNGKLVYGFFYDPGIYSYSAVTVVMVSGTSTSDVVNMSFYTPQIVDGVGLSPKDLVLSGISIPSSGSTGLRTVTLPSNLSFSGTGGGYYIYAFTIDNAGVTPTVRYGIKAITDTSFITNFGWVLSSAGTSYTGPFRIGNAQLAVINQVKQNYAPGDVVFQNTAAINWGFVLHTVR